MAKPVNAYEDARGGLHRTFEAAQRVDRAVAAEETFQAILKTAHGRRQSEMSYPYLLYSSAQDLLDDQAGILKVFQAAEGNKS